MKLILFNHELKLIVIDDAALKMGNGNKTQITINS